MARTIKLVTFGEIEIPKRIKTVEDLLEWLELLDDDPCELELWRAFKHVQREHDAMKQNLSEVKT